ncbi:MAG: MlaD family protein, partial [Solirubrobacteraceae bacterium]
MTTARLVALAALAGAILVVALIFLTGGAQYTVRADFQDAGGLVAGNEVMIGAAQVGTVQSIGLTATGEAQAVLDLDPSVGRLPTDTVARIYENSLSGIADKYIVLEPGPANGQTIPNDGLIAEDHTYSEVSLDALFDTFDPLTRTGLEQLIRGEGASIQGRGEAANRLLEYLAPGLASTSEVTAELTRDQPAFDGLVVQGAQALQALASRSEQLSALIANANATAAAIG